LAFFNFVEVAYTSINKDKTNQHIMEVYKSVKHHDVPDTYIVRCIFPKHNIFISYRTWVSIKNTPEKSGALNQLALFN
jgi:hypothetical protein